jgi:pimeloyl-ACP methyl ester carboxylesterase
MQVESGVPMTRKHFIAPIRWLLVSLQTLTLCAAPLGNLKASGKAEVRGTHLYYEVYGHGAPLVFLHAGLADSRMWDSQVKFFSHNYTVVRLDMRGYGQSDAPTGPYSPAQDVFALFQFLKLDRACIIGLSMGGTQAIDVVAAHPQAASCLVIVAGSPGWLQYSETMGRRGEAIAAAAREKGATAMVEGWMDDPMLVVARTRPRIEREMRMFLKQSTPGILGIALRAVAKHFCSKVFRLQGADASDGWGPRCPRNRRARALD